MPKRKSAEERLAETVNELGPEKAESLFRFLKAMRDPKPEPKVRKKKDDAQKALGVGQ